MLTLFVMNNGRAVESFRCAGIAGHLEHQLEVHCFLKQAPTQYKTLEYRYEDTRLH